MALAGFLSFSSRPVLDALRHPLRHLGRGAARPTRLTPGGKIYLGEGQPAMLLPVLGGGTESTTKLRGSLARAGFSAYDWGLGRDSGPGEPGLDACLRRLEEQVVELFEAERRTITLIGWSLSGIYAREVAKRLGPLVRQVITLGTPFNTAADPRRQCEMLQALDGAQRLDGAVRRRIAQRPTVPCTSIYSMSDPAAPWQLCVQSESGRYENVQVMVNSHLEMPLHPKVIEVITHRLAQPDDEWRPFRAR